jgi:hypothetical protein
MFGNMSEQDEKSGRSVVVSANPLSRRELLDLNQHVIESVRRMTPQEGMACLIKAGIYTAEGIGCYSKRGPHRVGPLQ